MRDHLFRYFRMRFLSVNQLKAQIKLTEVWKSWNTQGYPILWEICLRCWTASLIEHGRTIKLSSTFISDATRLWNKAPESVKKTVLQFIVPNQRLRNLWQLCLSNHVKLMLPKLSSPYICVPPQFPL